MKQSSGRALGGPAPDGPVGGHTTAWGNPSEHACKDRCPRPTAWRATAAGPGGERRRKAVREWRTGSLAAPRSCRMVTPIATRIVPRIVPAWPGVTTMEPWTPLSPMLT